MEFILPFVFMAAAVAFWCAVFEFILRDRRPR